jgi:hypothetical protein
MGANTRIESAPAPRCGDTVLHRPSGEEWVVAYADAEQDVLAWAGWPDGRARLSDCEIIQRCSEETHRAQVASWLRLTDSDSRPGRVRALYSDAANA